MTHAAQNPLLDLEEIVSGASDLAALPQVVMRVLDLTLDQKATAADMEKVIAMDQALAAKILILANSSYYGLPRQVSTLREAVVFLGFKTVRNLASTVTTFNLFLGRSDTASLARRTVWRHSMDTAQCARVITSLLHPSAQEIVGMEQAYTCALLHDIGKIVLDRSRQALFVAIMEIARTRHIRYSEIETQVFPFSHGQIGAAVAGRWNFPPALCEAIAFHHTPRAAEMNPKLTATVCLANEIAHYLEDAACSDAGAEWAGLLDACQETMFLLRISEESLHGMARSCRTEMEKGLSTLAF